jgi:hypothetical protein
VEIHEAPHGINIVVDTEEAIYIGRFDKTNGFEAVMHDCAEHHIEAGEDTEAFVKQTAKYGIAVDHKDLTFPTAGVTRVRILGDIPK